MRYRSERRPRRRSSSSYADWIKGEVLATELTPFDGAAGRTVEIAGEELVVALELGRIDAG